VIACYLPATGAHWIILAGCLAGGFGSGMVQVQAGTLLQLLSPAEMLGRIGGFFQSVQTTGILAGTVVAPLLVPWMVTQRDYFLSMFILMSVVVVFIVLTCKKILTGGGLKISSSGENQN
jgi:MFS family permease